jgi:flagellar motor switch protein FliN/FliY
MPGVDEIDKSVKDVIDKIAEQATNDTINPPEPKGKEALFDPNKLGILNDVTITLTIEIGRAQIKIRDLLNLTKDSIIDLNKLAGEPVDIYANGKLIAKGNIITANGKYCVRLTSIPEKS